jgi:hypothetical protein
MFSLSRFENNRAISSGGALGGQGANTNYIVRFVECEFINNRAGVVGGVGVFNNGGVFEFEDCKFENNVAQKGGVFGVKDKATVKDTNRLEELFFPSLLFFFLLLLL